MKGVQETCCMCATLIDDNSVHFLCNCLITICKECAYEQLARNRSTFRSHIVCPVCGSQECNSANQVIGGVENAEHVERELIKEACTFFKESKPLSFQKKVLKLIPLYRKLIVSFSELGYPSLMSPFVNGTHRDDVHVLGLHVARCEAHRQETERLHGTSNFIPLESRPEFALGPLEKVILKPNYTLEKILDIATGRDREANRLQLHCPSCYENLGPGNTVRTMCSCFTYNCQLCQRRILKNYKNTFRESPAKCMVCNSPSIPLEKIPEARELERLLLEQHPMFKTTATVSLLYSIYAEIAEKCKMDRAIKFEDFIDQNQAEHGRGSNNYCSKAMCFLEMARMVVERTRRKFYGVPEEERSDVSNLPLGPLARLRIRRHVFLEAFINFVRGTDTSTMTDVVDLTDHHTMKDPEALFDETTNRLYERDGPGGELEASVVRKILQEVQDSIDESKNRTFSLLLRTQSAPCPHRNCTFDAHCPEYLEQHINSIHVLHLDEAEVITPKRRPSRKAAQAAQAALQADRVANLDSFEEDDLNRALAESLLTSEETGSTSSASRASSRIVARFRDGEGDEEEESDDDVRPQRTTRTQRQSASATTLASRAAQASRILPTRSSRRSGVSRTEKEPCVESPVEEKEKEMAQKEADGSDSDSPESVSEEELEDLPRSSSSSSNSVSTSAGASATASTSSTSSRRGSAAEAPRSSVAAISVEQASHRIKKRTAAYLEDEESVSAASTAASAVAAAASSAERQPVTPASVATESTEDHTPPSTKEDAMRIRKHRREILIEAEARRQAERVEEEKAERAQESPEQARSDKRVRFASAVECQEYVPPIHMPEVVEIDVEKEEEAPAVPSILSVQDPPKKEDFLSIEDHLQSSRVIPPPPLSPRPPSLVPSASVAPLPPRPSMPAAVAPVAVQCIGSRPPSPPRPPEPSSDEEEEDRDTTDVQFPPSPAPAAPGGADPSPAVVVSVDSVPVPGCTSAAVAAANRVVESSDSGDRSSQSASAPAIPALHSSYAFYASFEHVWGEEVDEEEEDEDEEDDEDEEEDQVQDYSKNYTKEEFLMAEAIFEAIPKSLHAEVVVACLRRLNHKRLREASERDFCSDATIVQKRARLAELMQNIRVGQK